MAANKMDTLAITFLSVSVPVFQSYSLTTTHPPIALRRIRTLGHLLFEPTIGSH